MNLKRYPCPAAASLGTNSQTNKTGEWFCTISKDSAGGPFPAGAKANCTGIARGVFGYSWPAKAS